MHEEPRDRESSAERARRRAEREARRRARRQAFEERRRERKERVLHTRISDSLAEDIQRLAGSLRVPVSNLVRNVLEEAFSVVETVGDNVGELVEDVVDQAELASERYRRGSRARGHGGVGGSGEGAEAPGGPPPREGPEPRGEPEPEGASAEVLGWQPLVLARDAECTACGRELRRGRRAFVGLSERGRVGACLCRDCVPERS